MIIGITGSFGSGKTAVANMFRKHGFRVINVDKLYSRIYKKNNSLKKRIKREFNTLDRNKIKKIVFNDSKKLKKLNKITHPVIIKEIKREIADIKKESIIKKIANKKINLKSLKIEKINKKNSIIKKFNNKIENNVKSLKNNKINIIIDAPLLLEAKAQNLVDKIIVVKCSKKQQIKRILKKGKYSRKEIGQIIKSQMPLKQKIKKADFVVDNSGTTMETERQIKLFLQKP